MKCIQSDGRRMCKVPSGKPVAKGTVFKVEKDCYSSAGNLLIKTYCLGKMESSQLGKDLGDKASLLQLQKVLNEVLFEQLQAQFNTLELTRSINKLQESMTNVVGELSKANPIFLGIITKINAAQVWQGLSEFVTCPCKKLNFDGRCLGNLMMDGNTLRQRTISDDCWPLDKQTNENKQLIKL